MSETVTQPAPTEQPVVGEIVPLPDDEAPAVRLGQELVAQDDWQMLRKVAQTVFATDFVPKGIRGNAPAVMACLLYGREQGLGPMKALQEIAIIDGQPSESAALLAAKIRAAGHKVWREELRADDGSLRGTTAHGERVDGTRDSFTFTLEMAERAGLLGKKNWTQYPEAMLWARAVAQLARFLFSDVFLGAAYTAEELGADTTDENGAPLDERGSGGAPAGPGTAAPQAAGPPSVTPREAPVPGPQNSLESPAAKPVSAAQKKKLNVLYGKLTGQGQEQRKPALVAAAGGADGETWEQVRERLSMAEAHDLIERLERYDERLSSGGDEPGDGIPV